MTLKSVLAASFLALGPALAAPAAFAADIEVKMLNKGADGEAMVFEPAAIRAAVGDTIHFVPVDKGHDAAAVKELLPEGVEEFKGKMNQELVVTVAKEGAYVVKCSPHWGMGMVALVVVGEGKPANLDAVKAAKMPKKTRDRLDAAIAQLGL
ncbi:pseudoazurin [Rhizobium sp. RU35A]|uniref:Pseudoazurin n=1 Tax=Rhizobium straminoryzae TaxID=1387186 RepID=A0A549TDE6_9HYPH|nr:MULTISPECIES: pseudoazurin [Rhizobium]TRL40081.1 pseudoazurin [Rhizobium straminoryzae]SIQ20952.1 pseudoazurin [Rhizobium sp. RU35A]